MIVGEKNGRFHNYSNKLFSGRPILEFVAVPLVLVFVVLIYLSALFVLFLAWRQKRLYLPYTHSLYSSSRPSGQTKYSLHTFSFTN